VRKVAAALVIVVHDHLQRQMSVSSWEDQQYPTLSSLQNSKKKMKKKRLKERFKFAE
jgi:hypothetical protein